MPYYEALFCFFLLTCVLCPFALNLWHFQIIDQQRVCLSGYANIPHTIDSVSVSNNCKASLLEHKNASNSITDAIYDIITFSLVLKINDA